MSILCRFSNSNLCAAVSAIALIFAIFAIALIDIALYLFMLSVWLLPILLYLLFLAQGFISAGCLALIMVVIAIITVFSTLGLFIFSIINGEPFTNLSMSLRFVVSVFIVCCAFNPAYLYSLVIAVLVLISNFLINSKFCKVSDKHASVSLNILITGIEWMPPIVAFVLSMKALMIIAAILTLVIESLHFFVFLYYSLSTDHSNIWHSYPCPMKSRNYRSPITQTCKCGKGSSSTEHEDSSSTEHEDTNYLCAT